MSIIHRADCSCSSLSSMTETETIISPYRVSTITCNGSIRNQDGNDFKVDLTKLYDGINVVNLEANESGFIYVMDRDGKQEKGIFPKKKRPDTKKKDETTTYRRFDNAISTYYKLREDYYPSVKIFKNGTIQMTGIKKIEDGEEIHQKVFDTMKQIYDCDASIFSNELMYDSTTFYVRMINSDFSVSYHIRRKDLHHLLISDQYQNSCSFQPGTYPGVKLQYFWNPVIGHKDGRCNCKEAKCFGKGNGNGHGQCKKVTVSIFESGKILITGATNFEQINEAYDYICKVLREHASLIRKQYI